MAVSNTTSSVYDDMREKIHNGELPPSANLTEADLAARYGVSRNTVKKALLMLERENLVSIEPNKSSKVRSYSLNEVLEYLEVRMVLEGFIVRLAVPAVPSEGIAELEGVLAEMRLNKEHKNLIGYSDGNRRFHEVIYGYCPNRTAVDMTAALKSQMSKYNTRTILIPGRDEQSLSEHTAILGAVKAREPDLAEALMRKHIFGVRKAFEDNYSLLF